MSKTSYRGVLEAWESSIIIVCMYNCLSSAHACLARLVHIIGRQKGIWPLTIEQFYCCCCCCCYQPLILYVCRQNCIIVLQFWVFFPPFFFKLKNLTKHFHVIFVVENKSIIETIRRWAWKKRSSKCKLISLALNRVLSLSLRRCRQYKHKKKLNLAAAKSNSTSVIN